MNHKLEINIMGPVNLVATPGVATLGVATPGQKINLHGFVSDPDVDNIWFNYLYGIEDLKRVTKPYTKTIFDLNAKESPYHESNRLFRMFHLLPVGNIANA